jgi:transcription antitermination factor NusG
MPSSYWEPWWYAAYTTANHEKRVAEQLAVRSVEHFLPQYASVRRWKDRRVRLELPLFPGYVFVRLALRDRLQVLKIPGVAKLVGFNGTLPQLYRRKKSPRCERVWQCGVRAEPHPCLIAGRRIRIKAGPLTGLEGILLRRKGNVQVVLSVDLLQRSISIGMDLADVGLVN